MNTEAVKRLRAVRAYASLSGESLASLANINISTLRQFDSYRRDLTIENMVQICAVLGVDVYSLEAGPTPLEMDGSTPYNATSFNRWCQRAGASNIVNIVKRAGRTLDSLLEAKNNGSSLEDQLANYNRLILFTLRSK
jgi:transcriptional regulator with XRE-family HTH domain